MTTDSIETVEMQALSIPEKAKALIVASNEQYEQGESLLVSCKQMEHEIHEAFDGIVEKAHLAHKEAVAKRTSFLKPIEEGRIILKVKMIAYQTEQERIRQEEQRRLEAEAKERAEREALEQAIAAEQSGDTETAEAIISEPVYVAPVIAPKVAPAASRLSAGREIWSAHEVDLMLLVKAIAEGKQPVTLVMANMPALNKMASALKSSMSVPGYRAIMRKV